LGGDVEVDGGSPDVVVAEEFLDMSEGDAGIEKVCRKT